MTCEEPPTRTTQSPCRSTSCVSAQAGSAESSGWAKLFASDQSMQSGTALRPLHASSSPALLQACPCCLKPPRAQAAHHLIGKLSQPIPSPTQSPSHLQSCSYLQTAAELSTKHVKHQVVNMPFYCVPSTTTQLFTLSKPTPCHMFLCRDILLHLESLSLTKTDHKPKNPALVRPKSL